MMLHHVTNVIAYISFTIEPVLRHVLMDITKILTSTGVQNADVIVRHALLIAFVPHVLAFLL
jgi:hypothetical protein